MSEDAVSVPEVTIDFAKELAEPRLLSILFYEYYNKSEAGKVNLLSVYDRITFAKEITRHSIGIFVKTANTIDGNVRVSVVSPTGKVLGGMEFGLAEEVPECERFPKIQVMIRFEVDALEEGYYWFDVSYKDRSLGGAALQVEFKLTENKDGHVTGNA